MTDTATDLVLRSEWEVSGVRGVLVRINRPSRRNPLDHTTVRALLRELDDAEATPGLRCFVITGAGAAFSAGGDLIKYIDLYANPREFNAFLQDFKILCERLERGSLVTCAMINGACVAGGTELALACDFIAMSQTARIGDGHLGSGQLPGAGGSQRLGRAIGWQKAKEWMLSGRLYTAEEAESCGLVALVGDPAELEEATIRLIAASGKYSPHAYRTMKQLIDIARQTTLDEGLSAELDTVHHYATTSHDATEGIHAFLEKRPPAYRALLTAPGSTVQADLRPRTKKGNHTRAVLMDSARKVFGRNGYKNARISDITAEAKLSQGSFYRYFNDKEDVLDRLLENLLHDVVEFARDNWQSAEPAHSIQVTTRKYLSFYQKNADLYALLIEVAQSNTRVREMWIEARDLFYQRTARMIIRAQSEGLADEALDAELAATLLGGMTEQYAYASFVEGRPLPFEFNEIVSQISRIWARAIFHIDLLPEPLAAARASDE